MTFVEMLTDSRRSRASADGNRFIGSDVSAAALRALVAEDLADHGLDGLDEDDQRELSRSLVMARLQDLSATRIEAGLDPLDPLAEREIAREVLDSLLGLGKLQYLIDDSSVENIDVNGCDAVWVTRADGTKSLHPPIASRDAELVEVIRSAAARLGLSERRFDHAHPELDLRLPDGSRLSALMAVSRRPVLSVRRHRFVELTLEDLVTLGAMDRAMASFLAAAVRARKNLIVAGAMNSGKTTLMRALCNEISPRERLVTIEQAFELGLDTMPQRHPDMVALEARQANAEGEGEIAMSRLVRRALRMNADRVIVGEVLGDEVVAMLNAMSQGRSGSMCTIHADSSAGVFRRIASYAAQAAERLPLEATNLLIAGAIHFVVFLDVAVEGEQARGSDTGEGGFAAAKRRRFISSVREVVDAEGVQVISNEVYRPGVDRAAVVGAPLRAETVEELMDNGFDPSLGGRYEDEL